MTGLQGWCIDLKVSHTNCQVRSGQFEAPTTSRPHGNDASARPASARTRRATQATGQWRASAGSAFPAPARLGLRAVEERLGRRPAVGSGFNLTKKSSIRLLDKLIDFLIDSPLRSSTMAAGVVHCRVPTIEGVTEPSSSARRRGTVHAEEATLSNPGTTGAVIAGRVTIGPGGCRPRVRHRCPRDRNPGAGRGRSAVRSVSRCRRPSHPNGDGGGLERSRRTH